MKKSAQSQKGSGIIAFIAIPLVISAIVMIVGGVSGPRETPSGQNGTVAAERATTDTQ
jgi:hypothetical protein